MRICTVDNCNRKHVAKGMCQKHYVADRRKTQGRQELAVTTRCTFCGVIISKVPDKRYRRFCTGTCRDAYCKRERIGAYRVRPGRQAPAPKTPRDMRSPLRRAVEDGHHEAVIAAVRGSVEIVASGCWEWRRVTKRGYPVVLIGKRSTFVHRLVLEAKCRAPLGKQAAHHTCANTVCVNPDHLQPISSRENSAEMLARNYLESRIRDLEAALALTQPDHPLLHEVGISRAA